MSYDFDPTYDYTRPGGISPMPQRYTLEACPRCLHTQGCEVGIKAIVTSPCRMCGGVRAVLVDQYSGTLKKIEIEVKGQP